MKINSTGFTYSNANKKANRNCDKWKIHDHDHERKLHGATTTSNQSNWRKI